ncbi:MAG: Sir2 family NAD-dependent protein deacetylase, partial [Fusobacteriaceae bacterium]
TLYGENLDDNITTLAIAAIEKADTLIVAGTSLTVYPAAYYLQYFKGANLVIINADETKYDKYATLVIRDSFADAMDYVVESEI